MDDTKENLTKDDILKLAVSVVSAYVSQNSVPTSQIPDLIQTTFQTLNALEPRSVEAKPETLKPAVSIRKSITADYLVCLEDGKKLKMLKRHLRTNYNLTPEEYRAKWNLPSDYPMVAPNYAMQRSEFAKKIGLGRKGD